MERCFERRLRHSASLAGSTDSSSGGRGQSSTAPALRLEVAAAALDALRELAPMQKAILVKGLFAAVSADGTIRVVEAELMRLVGAVLDCPLPPLLEAVDPATLSA